MINFSNNKNKKMVSAVIIILLVLAMVLPMVESLLECGWKQKGEMKK